MGPDQLNTGLRNNVNQPFTVYREGLCDSMAFGDLGSGTYDASQTSAD